MPVEHSQFSLLIGIATSSAVYLFRIGVELHSIVVELQKLNARGEATDATR